MRLRLPLFFGIAPGIFLLSITSSLAQLPASPVHYLSRAGSTYIPLDSWIYPAVLRLYGKGYVGSVFVGLRPWTRLSVLHMLELSADRINASGDDEAQEIFLAIQNELSGDIEGVGQGDNGHAELDSIYTRPLGIAGTPLRDSWHIGQTIINDYGRPYESGFNNITGLSGRAEAGRFTLYFRGEYQHAPSATGYSAPVAQVLSENVDLIPYGPNQATIPQGPIPSTNVFRIVEADAAYHLLGHEISLGKTDGWLGPGAGGAFGWSNNSQDIYSFRINRVEPLRIPIVSYVLGTMRYDFFVGSLKGHTYPNSPWVHAEKFSFKPFSDLEFGFGRTVIWGGKDHTPITIHTFLHSFFSIHNVSEQEKFSRNDPGARFATFDFTWRPYKLQKWMTFYVDSFVHDDVSPLSAPRRAAYRPGIYLSHLPGLPKLDFRLEAANTDPTSSESNQGRFLYWETIQRQGITNDGFIFGDWIGREDKGGQAWLTYHLNPAESIQFNYRNAKAAKDFIPGATTLSTFVDGGTTQNDYAVDVVKRFGELEVNAWLQYERWNVPLLKPGPQSDTAIQVQFTWRPKDYKVNF